MKRYDKTFTDRVKQILDISGKVIVFYLYGVGINVFCKHFENIFSTEKEYVVNIDLTQSHLNIQCELAAYLHLAPDSSLVEIKETINKRFFLMRRNLVLNIQFDEIDIDRFVNLVSILEFFRRDNTTSLKIIINLTWSNKIEKAIGAIEPFTYVKLFKGAFAGDSFDDALAYFEHKNRKLTKEEKKAFWLISGGIPLLYKQAYVFSIERQLNILGKEFILKFTRSERFQAFINRIIKDLGSGYFLDLVRIAKGFPIPPNSYDIFEKFNLIDESKSIISHALKLFLVEYKESLGIDQFEIDLQKLFRISTPIEYIFTKSELKFLSLLAFIDGNVVSRELLAYAIWGEKYVEKYSDYSIDKHVSNIRKKLKKAQIKFKILSIRKQGLALIVSM